MNDTTSTNQQPSTIGSFFRGLLSGAGSGLLMAGLVTAVTFGLSFTPFAVGYIGWAGTLMMTSATALFSGVMSAKRAMFDAPETHTSTRSTITPVPVAGLTAPMVSPSLDNSPEQAPTKSWVAQTGREADSQSRVQQILANGSLSDKDRASAILAAREAASTQDNQRLV